MAPALTIPHTDEAPLLEAKKNGVQSQTKFEVSENYDGSTVSRRSRSPSISYFNTMYDRAVSDVVIIGAGSAGLSCAYHLAKSRPDLKITILEANVAPGGGAWLGGQLMTPMVVPCRPLHIDHSSKVLAFPNVVMMNATAVEDLIIREDYQGKQRVAGVVTNWTLVALNHDTQSAWTLTSSLPRSSSPLLATTAPWGLLRKRLVSAGLLKELGNMRGLDMNRAEPAIVNGTREVAPGLIMTGMELSEHDGSNRMGPTFGAMFASGIKAAKEAIRVLDTHQVVDGKIVA
ncbi:thiazole biosynthetic enzyme [Irpex lacteus]|nr:thiazole biosynthetic enzyme [Irpex lacteus]